MATGGIIALAIAALGFAGVAVALALRQAGIREELAEVKADCKQLEQDRLDAIQELEDSREVSKHVIAELRGELEQLREVVDALPDSPAGRKLLSDRLDRMLQGPHVPADDGDGSA